MAETCQLNSKALQNYFAKVRTPYKRKRKSTQREAPFVESKKRRKLSKNEKDKKELTFRYLFLKSTDSDSNKFSFKEYKQDDIFGKNCELLKDKLIQHSFDNDCKTEYEVVDDMKQQCWDDLDNGLEKYCYLDTDRKDMFIRNLRISASS